MIVPHCEHSVTTVSNTALPQCLNNTTLPHGPKQSITTVSNTALPHGPKHSDRTLWKITHHFRRTARSKQTHHTVVIKHKSLCVQSVGFL